MKAMRRMGVYRPIVLYFFRRCIGVRSYSRDDGKSTSKEPCTANADQ
jgi:hypothetical protein